MSALESLISAACGPPRPGADAQAATKQLLGILGGTQPASGKENGTEGGSAKQLRATALACFKAAQAALAEGSELGPAAQHATLAAAALAFLEAQAAGPAAAAQLLPMRYNFVKRLVAARRHAIAWTEAAVLHAQLSKAAQACPATPDAANIAVGAVLMLLLCCVEGADVGNDKLAVSLQAAEALGSWLGVLPDAEAEKHRDALFKYLYKAAAQLLERKDWGPVPAVAATMATVTASEAHLQRVIQATHKFMAHLPESFSAEAAGAVVAALLREQEQLLDSVSTDAVGLLCTAYQRASTPDAASALRGVLLQCCASCSPAVQQAGLLLPCLFTQQHGDGSVAAFDWVQPVAAAVSAASVSLAALQRHLRGTHLPPVDLLRHASVAAAAFQPCNLLRKALAGPVQAGAGAAAERLGDGAAVDMAATQLELLTHLVSVAHAAATPLAGSATAALLASAAKQGHAAAVGLATAAKLRAAGGTGGKAPILSASAAAAMLGWDFGQYCSSGGPLPSDGLLSEQELAWLTAALYNVGVDLFSAGRFEAATAPLLAATTASICCLAEAAGDAGAVQALPQRAQEVAKRARALSDAQLRAGDASAAAGTLGHTVAALVQCGLGAAAWRELLSSLAKLTMDSLLAVAGPAEGAASAQTAPAPKGRGARSAKAAPGRSKTSAAASTSGKAEGVRLEQLTCSSILARHQRFIPAAVRVAVAEQELSAWATLAAGGDSVATAQCSRLSTHLLTEAFPAAQHPVEHARILLAAYQADLAAEGMAGTQLLTRAVSLLESNKVGGPQASALAGRAWGLLALGAAQRLMEQSMLDQRQQRQQSHAAASTSSSSSSQSAAGLAAAEGKHLPCDLRLEAWRSVAEQAEAAVQRLEAAAECREGQHPLPLEEWEALAPLLAELGYLAALRGLATVEVQCQQLCLDVLSAVPPSASSRLTQWAAITPAGGWLCSCLFPALWPAMAGCTPQLGLALEAWPISLAALRSCAGDGQQLDLITLHARLSELAAAPRQLGSALQRACLHRLVAEQEAGAGSVVSALYHATEAHRLVFNAVPAGQTQPAGASTAGPVGWWQLAAEQLCSLLQLGRLFELSGMADEALHALKEGLRMAVSMGSPALAATFRVHLADVYSKQGSPAAQAALQPVSDLLKPLAAARQQAELAQLLRAQQQVVEARLSISAGSLPAAQQLCEAAIELCSGQAGAGVEADAPTDPWLASHSACVHAAALLASAECHVGQGEPAAAAQLAQEAIAVLNGAGAQGSSSSLQHRVAAALFLAVHQPGSCSSEQQQGSVSLWGLLPGAGPSSTRPAAAAAAAAKKPAGRGGRGKAAAKEPAEEAGAAGLEGGGRLQCLWQAYWLTREVPHLHRAAAAQLAGECGREGLPHLAALLLHASLGATMRQQYRLVLHTKLQQLQQWGSRAVEAGLRDAAEQCAILQGALEQLGEPLDGALVRQLAGLEATAAQPPPAAKGRRRAAAPAPPEAPAALLAELEQQARAALGRWVAALPAGTAICSISASPSSGGALGAGQAAGLVVSRLAAGGPPVVVQLPAAGSPGGMQPHPIKALSMEPEASITGVHSLAEEMLRLLEDSGRSMRDLATDTREQQREWWRARLELDDRLAALLQALGSNWLSAWRCLVLGAPTDGQAHWEAAARLTEQLQDQLTPAAGPSLGPEQLDILRAALAALLQGGSSLGPGGVQDACGQLCSAVGLRLSPEQVAAALQQGATSGSGSHGGEVTSAAPRPSRPAGRRAAADPAAPSQPAASTVADRARSEASTSASAAVPTAAPPARGRRGAAAKSVSFQVEELPEAAELRQQPQQQQPARPRRATGGRSSKAAGPAEPASEPEAASSSSSQAASAAPGRVAHSGGQPGGSGSGSDLCEAFDAISLEQQGDGERPRALTTARATKHRSRLKMMQATTPGPATVSRMPREQASTAAKAAATAPRLRGGSAAAAAGAEQPGASSLDSEVAGSWGAEAPSRGPVLLVLDSALQVLPWESVPGLRTERIYRIPSLACAAASAQRSLREVDLSSTFYSLNPSGDLRSTQSAFEEWFAQLHWEGKAGEPPTAAELAAALQSHQLFVYFGHGGGEQYIPAGKLRSLDSCSAALLIGCSSGRLRLQGHYEPTGAVLAYLLAGCPTAVANLWDVTDKDIDRFSQALLSRWLGSPGPDAPSASAGASGAASPAVWDISGAVALSRAACKLPHLIGGAPVCYGVPTSVHCAGGEGGC